MYSLNYLALNYSMWTNLVNVARIKIKCSYRIQATRNAGMNRWYKIVKINVCNWKTCSVKTFMLSNDILEIYIVFQLSKGTLVINIRTKTKCLKNKIEYEYVWYTLCSSLKRWLNLSICSKPWDYRRHASFGDRLCRHLQSVDCGRRLRRQDGAFEMSDGIWVCATEQTHSR